MTVLATTDITITFK